MREIISAVQKSFDADKKYRVTKTVTYVAESGADVTPKYPQIVTAYEGESWQEAEAAYHEAIVAQRVASGG